jgi:hypothetical protein
MAMAAPHIIPRLIFFLAARKALYGASSIGKKSFGFIAFAGPYRQRRSAALRELAEVPNLHPRRPVKYKCTVEAAE